MCNYFVISFYLYACAAVIFDVVVVVVAIIALLLNIPGIECCRALKYSIIGWYLIRAYRNIANGGDDQ